MGSLFDFRQSERDGLHVYVSAATDASFRGHLWPGLKPPYPEPRDMNPWLRYGINSVDGEELAVWRALAWAVTSGLDRYAIPTYYRDAVASWLEVRREDVPLVRWQYAIDVVQSVPEEADRGFVPARSAVRTHPPPDDWEVAHGAEAGLFRLGRFEDLTGVELGICGDVWSEVTIFGIEEGPHRIVELLRALRAAYRPKLADLLKSDEVCVDLAIVRDRFLGYTSFLSIKSHAEIGDRLRVLAEHYEVALSSYLSRLPELDSFESFCGAIDDLLLPPT